MTTIKGGARLRMIKVTEEAGLSSEFPAAVMAEVSGRERAPGIDDPSLVDRTSMPFVTIDGRTSKDLDQALFVERGKDGGYRVHYAIADTAYAVPKTSATFAEALKRGASIYLPGSSVPMLPRPLSEGIVSLNEGVDRRALVFVSEVGRDGTPKGTEVLRARVRSRKKLAWEDVQSLYDAPNSSSLAKAPFAESLALLREVGEAGIENAHERDVASYARREVDLVMDEDADRIVLRESPRLPVEKYNEQLSLLCNREGARLLFETHSNAVQPIYRVHPAPEEERFRTFAHTTQALARARNVNPAIFTWNGEGGKGGFARFVSSLPKDQDARRIVQALMRQAILVNARSSFATEPRGHFGVGADVYARFSAPMREIVGVYCHKELRELMDGARATDADNAADFALRARVVEAANHAKETQRKVNDEVSRIAIDEVFETDLATGTALWRTGTIVGLASAKVHVALDAPPMDVKVYLFDLGKAMGGAWLKADEDGVVLRESKSGKVIATLGDVVEVRAAGRDATRDRWVLEMRSPPQG